MAGIYGVSLMVHEFGVSKASRECSEDENAFRRAVKVKTNKRPKRRWVSKVKTDSTHPPPGLFKKDAATIARTLASKRVSPKGPGSGMRMLTYFINRAGRGLSPRRRAVLQRAKTLLSKRIHGKQPAK